MGGEAMANEPGGEKRIWIYRSRGSGCVRVHPSPIWLTVGQAFRVRDFTGQLQGIDWLAAPIDWDSKERTGSVRAGATGGHYEYEVTLTTGEHAEGNSRPGVIVD
jgi:hypothetical protein